MSIDKKFNDFLKDTLGVKIEDLKKGLTSDDEVTIEFNPGNILDDEALIALKKKVKQKGYNEGVVAGEEMMIKTAREKHELEFEGKTMDNFEEAYKNKILTDAKIEPDKKIKDLNTSLKKLRGQYETDIKAKDQIISDKDGLISELKNDNQLNMHLPENLTGLKPDQFKLIAKGQLDFGMEEGMFVAKKNGEILKDKMENPIPVKDVLTELANTNGWIDGGTPGRGGTDDPTVINVDKFENIQEVYGHLVKSKIDPMSKQGIAIIEKFEQSLETS